MIRRSTNDLFTYLLAGLVLVTLVSSSAEDSTTKSSTELFFNQQVESLLVNRCLECHAEKREGDLDLRTRATTLQGSESGVVLIPGEPLKSKLYELVYNDKMPPKHPLTDDEVDILKKWIEDGAYFPSEPLVALVEHQLPAEDWWSLMPLTQHDPPDSDAPTEQPIDRFIRATLTKEGLTPSPPANPRTLLRRITFDLHGLPPTPNEIDAFLAECEYETQSINRVGDTAYENLINRLLNSPRYGERWARHWLDIVHYGETHGFDKDQRRDNAWPYRDYVIRSFNDDKPYAEFVVEQLAGDVLKPDHPDGVIATGLLAAGPWDLVGQLEVREGTIEKKRVRNLDRDDIVTNVFNTFQSTTVQCARCHNHKFDPIDRAEYYKLQSVFAGIDRADRDYESQEAAQRRDTLNNQLEIDSSELEATEKLIQEGLPEKYVDAQKALKRLTRKRESLLPKENAESPSNGYHSVVAATPDEPQWIEIDLGEAFPLDELSLIPARPTDYKDTPGFGFPLRFTVRVSASDKPDDFHMIADHAAKTYPNPGDTPVAFDLKGQAVRRIRIDAFELWERNKDYAFALAEVEAIIDGKNIAQDKTVTAGTSLDFGRWSTKYLVDGYDSRQRRAGSKVEKTDELLAVESEIEANNKLSAKLIKRHTKKSILRTKAAQETTLEEVRETIAQLPKPNKVYSIQSLEPRAIFDLPRGNEATPGDQVFPAALALVPELSPTLKGEVDNEAATRLKLAQWIVAPENVLTWRSIVNRVWQYHFGRGIVDTPNDFGRAGSLPTHPELLDALAVEFQKTGSLKQLHRSILNSATYRQSSRYNAANAAIDGSNRYLWRMNTRKLDAESVHDSILSISGKLNLAMGGPSYEAFNYTHDHSPRYDFLGKDEADVWRRSVYRYIVRSVPDPLFEALDCADPSINTPVRNQTLTAPQALAMLNDAFILKQASHTEMRLTSEHESLTDQVDRLHMLALGRPPGTEEMSILNEFAEQHGLASLARLTFNLNEFIFVD